MTQTVDRPPAEDRSNRLSVTRAGGQLITDYWDDLFTAREQGKQIVWYNGGAVNPFLHLSLHLAVAEQLAIDQPPGLRAEFERLKRTRGDEHDALHAVLECLGETMWQAQRLGTGPDATVYLDCLRRQP